MQVGRKGRWREKKEKNWKRGREKENENRNHHKNQGKRTIFCSNITNNRIPEDKEWTMKYPETVLLTRGSEQNRV